MNYNIFNENVEIISPLFLGRQFINTTKKVTVNIKDFLKYVGPGLLISVAYIDPGNISGDMYAGLVGKEHLLWALICSTLLGYFYQIFAMRLAVVTGKDLSHLARFHYDKKTSIFLWIMAELAVMASDIQYIIGMSIGLQILFGIKLYICVFFTISSTMVILMAQNYGTKFLEVLFALLISIMAICFWINFIKIKPDGFQIFEGMFVPSVPSRSWLAFIGLIGSIIMPHNLYLQSSLVCKKNKLDRIDDYQVRKAMTYYCMETGFSLLISVFISLAIIGTFATFYNTGNDYIGLSNATEVLSQSLGSSAKYIWGIGILASGQSATITGTLAGQYIMTGYIKIKMSKVKRSLITRSIAIIPSLIIVFLHDSNEIFNDLNVVQAIQLPFVIIPLLKLCRSQNLMLKYKMGNKTFYSISFFSFLVVFSNFYAQMPEKNNLSSYKLYLFTVFVLLYGISLSYIFFKPIKLQKDAKIQRIKGQKNVIGESTDTALESEINEKCCFSTF